MYEGWRCGRFGGKRRDGVAGGEREYTGAAVAEAGVLMCATTGAPVAALRSACACSSFAPSVFRFSRPSGRCGGEAQQHRKNRNITGDSEVTARLQCTAEGNWVAAAVSQMARAAWGFNDEDATRCHEPFTFQLFLHFNTVPCTVVGVLLHLRTREWRRRSEKIIGKQGVKVQENRCEAKVWNRQDIFADIPPTLYVRHPAVSPP